MNTPNINNRQNAGDLVGRTRDSDARLKADRSTASGATGDALKGGDAVETQKPVLPVQDSFQSTRDRNFVRDLTDSIVNEEEPVREEAVARARQRIDEGYYNSQEFLGSLATRLINTDGAL